jgi:hypothetical protein
MELKLTKAEFDKIYDCFSRDKGMNYSYEYMKNKFSEAGFIEQDEIEQAIEKLNRYYTDTCIKNAAAKYQDNFADMTYDLSIKAIELLQNKIKGLEDELAKK